MTPMIRSTRLRRWLVMALGGAGLFAVACVVGWSAATVFSAPKSSTTEPSYLLVKSRTGTVEEEVPLKVAAQWSTDSEAVNQATGVVTSVDFIAGAEIDAGDRLYTVGLRPVFAAVGAVPSFRSLSEGDKGKDVEQLQRLLHSVGHLSSQPDGNFGPATTRAVKEWHRANQLEPEGTVEQGDVVYFSSLPARVVLEPKLLAVGKAVTGGESAIRALSAEPLFQASTTALQAGLLPKGTPVSIGEGKWPAVVVGHASSEDGNTVVRFAGPEGGTICGNECQSIPIEGSTSVDAMAITVAPQEGVMIPTGAVQTNADGSAVVLDRSGRSIHVKIVASARGQSIVEGLPSGVGVRIERHK